MALLTSHPHNSSQIQTVKPLKHKCLGLIMDDTELEDVTKNAMKEAKDTKVRLDHQNKVRVEKKVVLDFDPETNAKLVKVHDRIATKLYMYDVCLESIKRIEDHPVACCILALSRSANAK